MDDNKSYERFLTQINSMLTNNLRPKKNAASFAERSLVKSSAAVSANAIKEDLKKIKTLASEFLNFDRKQEIYQKMIENYIVEAPSSAQRSMFFNNPDRGSLGFLSEDEKKLQTNIMQRDEIINKIYEAINICRSIQNKVSASLVKRAEIIQSIDSIRGSNWSDGYKAGVELQHKDTLATGNNIAAIDANISLGTIAKEFADEDEEFREFALEEATQHYVKALTLAKNLEYPQYIPQVIGLLKEIGRDENGNLSNTFSNKPY